MVNEYHFLTCMVHKPYKKKVTGNESGSLLLKLDVAVVASNKEALYLLIRALFAFLVVVVVVVKIH